MSEDLQLLKSVLSVPTKTYKEDLMVKFLVEWCQKEGLDHYVDEYKNVYEQNHRKMFLMTFIILVSLLTPIPFTN